VQVDQIKLSGIVERYIVFETSGSIKERSSTHPNEHRNGWRMSTKWLPQGFCIN